MTFNFKKHKHVVRDIYDGRIITETEAISLRNLHLVREKEAMGEGDE